MQNETRTNHRISLDQAKKMTKKYKEGKKKVLKDEYKDKNVLPTSISFDREPFDQLLAKGACKGLRMYFGMNDGDEISLVIVGVDANGNDMLPSSDATTDASPSAMVAAESARTPATTTTEGDELIIDTGYRCPPQCPATSPLNG